MKSVTIETVEQKKILIGVVSSAPEGGYGLKDIRTGVAAIETIEAGDLSFQLEDEHYAFIRRRLEGARWSRVGRDILNLLAAFKISEE